MDPLQAVVQILDPAVAVAVVGLYLGLAAFLSLTAFVAARNVLGTTSVTNALLVGPVPALASFLQGVVPALRAGPGPVVLAGLALALDLAAIRWAYDLEWKTAAYVAFVHVVFSVVLATLLVAGGLLLVGTAFG